MAPNGNCHALPVAKQKQITEAPCSVVGGGRVLLPQLEEAGRDLADGGVCGRARQDTAASGLAHQQQ